jgi:hypothetical protein
VFGTIKKALRGWRFHSDDEVKKAVHFWLRQQAKTLFFYWDTEACQKMWKVYCKGQWLHGKITPYLDLYIWSSFQCNAICPYWSLLVKFNISIALKSYHLETFFVSLCLTIFRSLAKYFSSLLYVIITSRHCISLRCL